MLALVTSTLIPPSARTALDVYRNLLTPEIRLAQTKKTIESLLKLDFEKIYIIDNSVVNIAEDFSCISPKVKFLQIPSYQFVNKGLSELFLIEQGLKLIEESDMPILKISGRYTLSANLNFDESKDFLFKFEGNKCVSTRCYISANKRVYQSLIDYCINHYLSYNSVVRGPRSLVRILRDSLLGPEIFTVELMLEEAIRFCLQKYKVQECGNIGLFGLIGGESANEIINE